MKYKIRSKEQKLEIVKDYDKRVSAGEPKSSIAASYGVTAKTLKDWKEATGVTAKKCTYKKRTQLLELPLAAPQGSPEGRVALIVGSPADVCQAYNNLFRGA